MRNERVGSEQKNTGDCLLPTRSLRIPWESSVQEDGTEANPEGLAQS